MTYLPDAIGDALDNAYAPARMFPPVPRADQLSDSVLMRAVWETFGVTKGAQLAGIDRRTVQRAKNRPEGKQYKATADVRAKLRAAYDDQIRAAREAERARRIQSARASVYSTLTAHKSGTLTIHGKIVVSNDARPRDLKLGRVFTGSTKRAIVDAYLDHDLERAAYQFNLGLSRDYLENPRPSASDMYVERVDTLTWR